MIIHSVSSCAAPTSARHRSPAQAPEGQSGSVIQASTVIKRKTHQLWSSIHHDPSPLLKTASEWRPCHSLPSARQKPLLWGPRRLARPDTSVQGLAGLIVIGPLGLCARGKWVWRRPNWHYRLSTFSAEMSEEWTTVRTDSTLPKEGGTEWNWPIFRGISGGINPPYPLTLRVSGRVVSGSSAGSAERRVAQAVQAGRTDQPYRHARTHIQGPQSSASLLDLPVLTISEFYMINALRTSRLSTWIVPSTTRLIRKTGSAQSPPPCPNIMRSLRVVWTEGDEPYGEDTVCLAGLVLEKEREARRDRQHSPPEAQSYEAEPICCNRCGYDSTLCVKSSDLGNSLSPHESEVFMVPGECDARLGGATNRLL
ncbi:unnamed protein product [Protopolystoma xenopodis]|uniref:Uncharacterized protein n=1 Tax=Protopolystoma xenopodis TaxID=117903 RepID=A0A3S5BPC8_9PLAT|nr:unnamed protein product [Protopolystoma xenopodis]